MLKWKPIAGVALALGAAVLAGPQLSALYAQEAAPPKAEQGQRARMHRGRGGRSGEGRLQRMTQLLNLTAQQQARIKPILEKNAQELRALMQDGTLSREQKREKLRPILEASQIQINAVLTAEQRAKWAELRERMKSRGAGAPNRQT